MFKIAAEVRYPITKPIREERRRLKTHLFYDQAVESTESGLALFFSSSSVRRKENACRLAETGLT